MDTPEATELRAGLDPLASAADTDPRAASDLLAPTASPAPAGIDHTDRDAFGLRLQQHYHQHAVNDTPFLLIAMRDDGRATHELDFDTLYACASKLFTDEADWLVDLDQRRLVVLLAPGYLNDARLFFTRLKLRLLEAAPRQAEAYLHAISAITIANGAPFQNAEDFLTVALEET